ncbi:hypothetical protein SSAG_00500 [Streptomyces sp. Mg1]|nr:hypothetical protein SSAG_00500 [Streptomyces sp. Mg1]
MRTSSIESRHFGGGDGLSREDDQTADVVGSFMKSSYAARDLDRVLCVW